MTDEIFEDVSPFLEKEKKDDYDLSQYELDWDEDDEQDEDSYPVN